MKGVTIPSLGVTLDAKLVERDDGSVHLLYEGVRYAKEQFVPFHIFGVNSSPARHTTAAHVVTGTTFAKSGDDHRKWPVMALRFLRS